MKLWAVLKRNYSNKPARWENGVALGGVIKGTEFNFFFFVDFESISWFFQDRGRGCGRSRDAEARRSLDRRRAYLSWFGQRSVEKKKKIDRKRFTFNVEMLPAIGVSLVSVFRCRCAVRCTQGSFIAEWVFFSRLTRGKHSWDQIDQKSWVSSVAISFLLVTNGRNLILKISQVKRCGPKSAEFEIYHWLFRERACAYDHDFVDFVSLRRCKMVVI
jgi:hypothetical protein